MMRIWFAERWNDKMRWNDDMYNDKLHMHVISVFNFLARIADIFMLFHPVMGKLSFMWWYQKDLNSH